MILETTSVYYYRRAALILDQISTSPSPRTVNPPLGGRTKCITYSINDFTINGNYEPNLLAFLLQIINVLPIITSEQ